MGGGTAVQSYSVKGELDYESVPFTRAMVCVDDNNNGLADDNYCGNVNNDGSYEFTAWTDPAAKNLVAYVYESGNGGASSSLYINASTLSKSGDTPDAIMYASWKRVNDNITLKTTFIKALIDQDPAKAVTEAEKEVEEVINVIKDTGAILKSFRDIFNSELATDDNIRSVTAAIVNKYIETKSIVKITDITAKDIANVKKNIEEADKSAESMAKINAILEKAEVMPEIDLIKYEPVIKYIAENYCERSMIEFSADKMRNDFNIAMQNFFYTFNDTKYNIEMYYDDHTKIPFAELNDYQYCSSYTKNMGVISGYFYSYPSGMLEDSDNILEKLYKEMGCEVDEDSGSVKDISCYYGYIADVAEKLPTPKKYLWKLDTSKLQ